MSSRYAIYYAPKVGSPLAEFGASFLGRDTISDKSVRQMRLPDVGPEHLYTVTSGPRHYGFHATLKAPFRLAEGQDAAALKLAFAAFAASETPFTAPALKLRSIDGFLALTFIEPCPQMAHLAQSAVEFFEPFRAELTEEELIERRSAGLSEREDELLVKFGYPYVMEHFHFHMTLTQRLDAGDRAQILEGIAPIVEPIADRPLRVDAVALFHQANRDTPFIMAEHLALTG
ncbi:MAG: DUF1045 domain-containing protein [Alphaproteobacteria bacterium]